MHGRYWNYGVWECIKIWKKVYKSQKKYLVIRVELANSLHIMNKYV